MKEEITKRELFAKDILCALLQNADRHSQTGECFVWNYEHLSKQSIQAADALIEQLKYFIYSSFLQN